MTESAAFLAAICAQPADDTARLVYADWLDEHDDPVRATFIRMGVKHPTAQLPATRYARIDRVEIWNFRDLDEKYGGEWRIAGLYPRLREELPEPKDVPYLLGLSYRRGFVDSVRLTWEAWYLRADELRAKWPLSRVDLTTEPELGPQWDHKDKVWWDVDWRPETPVGGTGVVPLAQRLLTARWGGITFTSPASRRVG